jgi:hypothetical protein
MTQAQLVGAWRKLFVEPPVSPATERFLGLLNQTPYRWRQTADGKIRAMLDGAQICVITGAVRHWTGISFSVGDWVRAADVLGLSYRDAGMIVEAADEFRPPTARTAQLRQRLFAATGIEPRTAPVMRDPVDRALAELLLKRAVDGDAPSVMPVVAEACVAEACTGAERTLARR